MSSASVSRDHIGSGDRVHSFRQFAALIGVSLRTLKRLIEDGDGPVVTRLSQRRFGIRASHGDAWLDGRSAKGSE